MVFVTESALRPDRHFDAGDDAAEFGEDGIAGIVVDHSKEGSDYWRQPPFSGMNGRRHNLMFTNEEATN